MSIRRCLTAGSGAVALVGGLLVGLPTSATAAVDPGAQVVINEIYGGGGNTGATYKNDFVELINKGTTSVDLSGWSVQYAAAAGTNWSGVTSLKGSIAPGKTYLVSLASGGAVGADLPTPDASGTTNMSATAGNVALARIQTPLSCSTTACASAADVVDLVGFGSGLAFAGAPAPGHSNTTSISRDASATNTANNKADFTAGTPTPQNGGPTDPPGGGGGDPETLTIAQIQGTTDTSPYAGKTVTTKGIVTAAYPTGGFNGYVIQTPGTGGDLDLATHQASDAVFVFSSATAGQVKVGDYVQVTGDVSEFQGLTEISVASGKMTKLSDVVPAVKPITNTWPATDAQRESMESMLFAGSGSYTISNTYSTNQYGEVGLALGDKPLMQWTDVARPGTPEADAVKADNAARGVTLDDGASTNFLSAANSGLVPPYISLDKPVRVGEKVTFNKPVIVDYRNNAWKLQPTSALNAATPADYPATWDNNRTVAPAAVGGDVKVASFNVLNFFTMTGQKYVSEGLGTCTSYKDRNGTPITVNTCSGNGPRGAWDDASFKRQYDKTVAAINSSGANVVGLMEIENSVVVGEAKDTTLKFLVDQLNAKAGAGTWAYVSPDASKLPPLSDMDVINGAIIYQPAVVTPVGATEMLSNQSASGQAFGNAREPIAQVFAPKGGGDPFLFVVNHFKSKGSAGPWPGDKDTGDGQGASNESRIRQANALVDWIKGLQDSTKVEAVVTLGDYNSYSQEDPMQVLYKAGYTDAEHAFDLGKASYSFSGLSGSLDHVLLNDAALGRATGADIWNINSPESIALEYGRYNYHGQLFYAADPYASSDHDPVVVGLKAKAAPAEKTVQILGINDFHGRIQANGQEAGAAVLAGAVDKLRGDYPNSVFAAAGDLIGASTFESFIAHDKPTIDALNAAGLEVSAVGNHEFDQGYNDLVNRVMAPYNADTNPYGGAQWKYIGANVKMRASGNPALDPTWVKDFGGVQVGFIGAVTEHLDELVSPDGIKDIKVTDIPTAVNAEADKLKAEGVNIIVLLVHEGAPSSSCASVTGDNDFGKIVKGVNQNVDAIISGHTHLTYNCMVDVPAWAGRAVTQRPVVSAGQYGYNLDQLLFTTDAAGTVSKVESNTIALTSQDASGAWRANYAADGTVGQIVSKAVSDASVLGKQPLGQISGPFNRAKLSSGAENRGGESTLGNLVAEAQRWATESTTSGGAQIAFMNPGGLRADMVGDKANGYPAVLTYQQAATVQPFANTLTNLRLTGAQIKTVLEQQWQPAGSSRDFLRLGISKGFTYTYDPKAAKGSHITGMWLNGTPIDTAASYSVTANSFLAAGGDNFFEFANGTNKKDTGQTDLQGMVDYMAAVAKNAPLPVDYSQRSVGVSFPADAPSSYKAGDTVSFNLSSLALGTPGDKVDAQVSISIGNRVIGTATVDNTIGSAANDEYGTASVTVTLPADLSGGVTTFTVTGATTGTSVNLPAILVEAAPKPTSEIVVGLSSKDTTYEQGKGSGPKLTADVRDAGGKVVKSGSVAFYEGDTLLGTVALKGGSGKVDFTLAKDAALGDHVITAVHTDADGLSSKPSNAVTISVVAGKKVGR
ncbi:MAG: ExeM/NucH family extracellular endonuclease [Intrasporangium sp.]|uniref:ExeM/NucH family extracellular endonuclease n=1 Tax=Intrasporangium sp. TaxID=1925024 RepID=UPI003F7E9137